MRKKLEEERGYFCVPREDYLKKRRKIINKKKYFDLQVKKGKKQARLYII